MSFFLRNRLCFPVKGYNRAIVYNLIRMSYDFIPLDVYELIKTDGVISEFELNIIDIEWLEFLEKKEILFPIEHPNDHEKFPAISKAFEFPSLINSIIIHDNFPIHLAQNFESFYLLNISIICEDYDSATVERIHKLLNKICSLEVDSIYLYVKSRKREVIAKDVQLIQKIPQLSSILIFETDREYKNISTKLVDVINLPYSFEEFSRLMFPEKLRINYSYFFESHNYHTYYNGKAYIDKNLNIKNGINTQETFGKLGIEDFVEIVSSNRFRKLGNVTKNKTLICKECEFRYMCVDPRQIKQNNNKEWYHDIECNYNPYISKWSYEEDYINLKSSGVLITSEGKLDICQEKLHEKVESVWS